MIKIRSILIENFRGIKHLKVLLDSQNLVVQGPNGSGKSGVIDAIEFALSGNITRLAGSGTGGVSVKEHAPHVDFKETPEKAKVVIELSDNLGNIVTIERKVSSPLKPTVLPNNENSQKILSYLKEHPEFSLSRKEILKFILVEPGKRAKEVQSLLKMDAIEKLRAAFLGLTNQYTKDLKTKNIEVVRVQADLLTHLKIAELKKEVILEAINQRRKNLGLIEIAILEVDTKFSEGIIGNEKDQKRQVSKKDLETLITKTSSRASEDDSTFKALQALALESLNQLKTKPQLLQNISKQALYDNGIKLVLEELCPLCDTTWDIEKLKLHIQNKITDNKTAVANKDKIIAASDALKIKLKSLSTDVESIKKDAVLLGLNDDAETFILTISQIDTDLWFQFQKQQRKFRIYRPKKQQNNFL